MSEPSEPERRQVLRRGDDIDMYEMLIRIDERLAGLDRRIQARDEALKEMQKDIRVNTQRSTSNEHTVDRHEGLLNWLLRLVLGIVVVAILAAAGISSGAL